MQQCSPNQLTIEVNYQCTTSHNRLTNKKHLLMQDNTKQHNQPDHGSFPSHEEHDQGEILLSAFSYKLHKMSQTDKKQQQQTHKHCKVQNFV